MLTGYKRAIDVAGGRARTEQTRTPNFAYFQGQAAAEAGARHRRRGRLQRRAERQRDARVERGRAGSTRGPLPSPDHDRSRRARPGRQAGQSARRRTTSASSTSRPPTASTSRWRSTAPAKLPTRVVSMSDNTNIGDVAIETELRRLSGRQRPEAAVARLTTKTDKYTTAEIRVTKQAVDADAGELAAPAAAASAAPVTGPPPARSPPSRSGERRSGSLAGQSHHSVLVEFADHLMLIEAPQNDARTLAVIAKARELRPDKPLTQVVNTPSSLRSLRRHPRGGLAKASPSITHKSNAASYKDAMTRRAHDRAGRAGEEPEAAEARDGRRRDGAQGRRR